MTEPPHELSERAVVRGFGFGNDLELFDFDEDEPFELLHFDRNYSGARFGDGYRVERRGWHRRDLLLTQGGRPLAKARRRGWAARPRLRLDWLGQPLEMELRLDRVWEVLEDGALIGTLSPLLGSHERYDVEFESGTSDELLCFAVAVAELTRHHPLLRLARLVTFDLFQRQ